MRARQKAWRVANRERYLSRSTPARAKTCRGCRREQPVENFYPQIGTRDGRFSVCRECVRANTLAWQLSGPDAHRRAVDRWRAANRHLMAVAQTRSVDRAKGDLLW
jgi:hypothetical protein